MPEVPAHLVPSDGLTSSKIRMAGMDVLDDDKSGAFRFNFHDEDDYVFGTLTIEIGAHPEGNVDFMISQAHAKLRDMLRQWTYHAEQARSAYADSAKR